jgi:hypothetical protein
MWTSAWRSAVVNEAQRLENELAFVPADARPVVAVVLAREAVSRARAAAAERPSVDKWWSGTLVEQAWSNLELAGESLVLVQLEERVRAEIPYLQTLVAGRSDGAGQGRAVDAMAVADAPLDRDVLREILVEHHVGASIQHAGARQMRNRILGTAIALLVFMAAAGWLANGEYRRIMAVGALAGIVTCVLTLFPDRPPSGPYGMTAPQMLLKVGAGAGAATLAVLLLRTGAGGFAAATGDWALADAALFGFSQHLLTRLVDSRASAVLKGTPPRGAGPAAAAASGKTAATKAS